MLCYISYIVGWYLAPQMPLLLFSSSVLLYDALVLNSFLLYVALLAFKQGVLVGNRDLKTAVFPLYYHREDLLVPKF